jgi:hypothetical protein
MPRKIPWRGMPVKSVNQTRYHRIFYLSDRFVRFRGKEKRLIVSSKTCSAVHWSLLDDFTLKKGPVKVVGVFNFPYKPKRRSGAERNEKKIPRGKVEFSVLRGMS